MPDSVSFAHQKAPRNKPSAGAIPNFKSIARLAEHRTPLPACICKTRIAGRDQADVTTDDGGTACTHSYSLHQLPCPHWDDLCTCRGVDAGRAGRTCSQMVSSALIRNRLLQ